MERVRIYIMMNFFRARISSVQSSVCVDIIQYFMNKKDTLHIISYPYFNDKSMYPLLWLYIAHLHPSILPHHSHHHCHHHETLFQDSSGNLFFTMRYAFFHFSPPSIWKNSPSWYAHWSPNVNEWSRSTHTHTHIFTCYLYRLLFLLLDLYRKKYLFIRYSSAV